MSESRSCDEPKLGRMYLVCADGVRSEICDLERAEEGRSRFIPAFAPKSAPFARIEFMIRERESESNGFNLVKTMKQGDPFNFEIHAPDGRVIARSCTFLELLDATYIDDPTPRYIVRLRA